ncbi:hypothetical protein D3C84_1065930 [compost metagenome]
MVFVSIRPVTVPLTPIMTFSPLISVTASTLMRCRKAELRVIFSFKVCAWVGVTLNSSWTEATA